MLPLLDTLARTLATPMPRRRMLRLFAGTLAAAAFPAIAFGRGTRGDAGCEPVSACSSDADCRGCGGEPTDICTNGVCCNAGQKGCGGAYCCDPRYPCQADTGFCGCPRPQESCGEACCPEGSFCCDPKRGVCCPKDAGLCCYDAGGNGTCCSPGQACVPALPYYRAPEALPGRTCCDDDRACKGQCCPPGELCIGQLGCCPRDRFIDKDHLCCPPGQVAYDRPNGTRGCCPDFAFCNGVCCDHKTICLNGVCEPCPSGTSLCWGQCCDDEQESCCFEQCCQPGFVCCGASGCCQYRKVTEILNESTTYEKMGDVPNIPAWMIFETGTVPKSAGKNGAFNVQEFALERLTGPSTPLPGGAEALLSLRLSATDYFTKRPVESKTTGAPYRFYIEYRQHQLARLGLPDESTMDLLLDDGTGWRSIFPCAECGIDRLANRMVLEGNWFGEFALVARATATPAEPVPAPSAPGATLHAPAPNPFGDATTLRYALAAPGPVRLDVFDALGRRVATLVDEPRGAGDHAARFDAAGLAAGTYLARLTAGGTTKTRALVKAR